MLPQMVPEHNFKSTIICLHVERQIHVNTIELKVQMHTLVWEQNPDIPLTQAMMNFPFTGAMRMMLLEVMIVEFVISDSFRGGEDSGTGLRPMQLVPGIASRGQRAPPRGGR